MKREKVILIQIGLILKDSWDIFSCETKICVLSCLFLNMTYLEAVLPQLKSESVLMYFQYKKYMPGTILACDEFELKKWFVLYFCTWLQDFFYKIKKKTPLLQKSLLPPNDDSVCGTSNGHVKIGKNPIYRDNTKSVLDMYYKVMIWILPSFF